MGYVKEQQRLEQQRAWRKLHYHAIKAEPCIICGDTNTVAHHEDYRKPFDVVWFCEMHHGMFHKLRVELSFDSALMALLEME